MTRTEKKSVGVNSTPVYSGLQQLSVLPVTVSRIGFDFRACQRLYSACIFIHILGVGQRAASSLAP